MRPTDFSLLLLFAGSLLSSACTETVYREIPQYTTTDSNGNIYQTPTNQQTPVSNMTNGGNTDNVAPTPATTPVTGSQQIYSDSSQTGLIGDLTVVPAGTVAGAAGDNVNCINTVPCRWISADGQFALTVTNADNIASRERLSVNFTVTTLHDTSIVVGSIDDAIDSGSMRTKATDMTLGTGNGGSPVAIVAGSSVLGTINYAESASSNLLANFTISILDNGLVRKATLFNVPVGPITSGYAECNNTLPCIWSTPDGQVTISLLSVGGYAGNGRLTANFQVRATYDMHVSVDAGAAGVGNDGTRFSGRTHTLGSSTDYQAITEEAIANIGVAGSVDFYRTDSIPTSLMSLSLVLYEDSPSPRWNPRFASVPVQ